MQEPISIGRTKIDTAIAAVEAFLSNLDLPVDQAAIVAFNHDAWLLQPLTGDRGLLDASLRRVVPAPQTRLDRGVETAHEELLSDRRRSGNRAMLIVLTDGLANPVPVSVAVERALAAKTDGIVIFTIGVGLTPDEEALRSMATKPEFYHWAPDAEELSAIYRRIAVTVPCPEDAFWPHEGSVVAGADARKASRGGFAARDLGGRDRDERRWRRCRRGVRNRTGPRSDAARALGRDAWPGANR